MSSAAVIGIVRSALAAGWDASNAGIREPNTTFDPQGLPWIEIAFPGSRIDRGDIGEPDAPLRDEVGAFMVHVFVPVGAGEEIARAIADAVWEIYALKDLSGVRCDTRLTGQSGEREPTGVPGVWWGVSYGVSYRYQSVG